ncbi:MAG: hypothetical protein ABW184_09425 [Sphingobium sp.]
MYMQARSFEPCATSESIAILAAAEGTSAHGYCRDARRTDGFVRNAADFADAVHHLSFLHGQVSGLIDQAAARIVDNEARSWLVAAVDGFARERAYLSAVVVAAGPMPSTPGQAQVTTIVAQQCRALLMLARSDRHGCALGAAAALVLDWAAIRRILDGGAARLSVDMRECRLPTQDETLAMLDAVEAESPSARAIQFGASQLFGQHRGLWDLLQSRGRLRRDL